MLTIIALVGLILISPLLLYVLYREFKCYKIHRVTRHTPGPRPMPLVGNAHECGSKPSELLSYIFDRFYQYEKTNYKLWIGWYCNILISEVKDVEFILSSTSLIAKSDIYDMFKPWFGDGLLTSKGERWRKYRKIITPSFHFKILQEFHEVINQNTRKFIQLLKKVSEGVQIFDFQHQAHFVTLDIICETAMGVKVNAVENPDSQFVQSISYLTESILVRAFRPLQRNEFTFQFFPAYKKFHKAAKYMTEFTYDVIEKRIESRKREFENTSNRGNNENNFQKPKMAFLDTLLSATVDGKPLCLHHIQEEVSTFIAEGNDTTASSISFLIFLLSRHADVQQKVYEEQQRIMGDDMQRDATFQEISEMKYLDLVIKEAHRVYPSVPLIARQAEEEYNMNGKIIPADTTLVVCIMTMCYDEKVFPDPYRFQPERFDTTLSNECLHPYQYIPFSAGPRNCIGQKFAVLTVKTVVSKIVRSFQVLPALDELASRDGYLSTFFGPHRHQNPKPHKYDPILSAVISLKSENGLHIRLKERK